MTLLFSAAASHVLSPDLFGLATHVDILSHTFNRVYFFFCNAVARGNIFFFFSKVNVVWQPEKSITTKNGEQQIEITEVDAG